MQREGESEAQGVGGSAARVRDPPLKGRCTDSRGPMAPNSFSSASFVAVKGRLRTMRRHWRWARTVVASAIWRRHWIGAPCVLRPESSGAAWKGARASQPRWSAGAALCAPRTSLVSLISFMTTRQTWPSAPATSELSGT